MIPFIRGVVRKWQWGDLNRFKDLLEAGELVL